MALSVLTKGEYTMTTREEFSRELAELDRDAIREGRPPMSEFLGLEELSRAFMALYDHAEQEDLFDHTEIPTPEALLQIFSFLTLP